jgi:hypothetical protein
MRSERPVEVIAKARASLDEITRPTTPASFDKTFSLKSGSLISAKSKKLKEKYRFKLQQYTLFEGNAPLYQNVEGSTKSYDTLSQIDYIIQKVTENNNSNSNDNSRLNQNKYLKEILSLLENMNRCAKPFYNHLEGK